MKKILGFVLIFFMSLLLIGCDDLINDKYYSVSFYENDLKVEVIEVLKNTLIKESDIPYNKEKEFSHLLNKEDNREFVLSTKINKNYDFIIIYKTIGNIEDDPIYEGLPADTNGVKTFNTYYINDTHGAILNKNEELGLSRIGNYIKKSKDSKSLFLAGGDIFQGQLISNHNKGALMIEIFNEIGLDALVIGNHEFDWGLDLLAKYFDNSEHAVKANFPILGANVIEKATNKRPDFIKSHTIVKKDGYSVGIIGVIGDGLESSISTLRVKDYMFTNAYSAVRDTVDLIKDSVDFIMVVNHHNDLEFNEKVSKLAKVSAIFNGHSHSEYTGFAGDNNIPYIQSRHNGHMVGKVSLEFNRKDDLFTFKKGSATNIKNHSYLNSPDLAIDNIIAKYYGEIEKLYNETVLISSNYYSQVDLAYYISKVMMDTTGSVAGFQNSGGTRAEFSFNQKIKGADVFQVFPFDNQIIVVEISGRSLKQLLNNSYFFSSSKIYYESISDSNKYKIATNDYVYYHNSNRSIFESSYNTEIIFGDMYEILLETMINAKNSGRTYFNVEDSIIFNR